MERGEVAWWSALQIYIFVYLVEQLGLKLTQRFDVPAFSGTDDIPPFFVRPEPVAYAVEQLCRR